MRVVVLLKQVPDIISDRRLNDDGRLVRDQADATLNEIDEGALECALRAAEVLGGSVTALTLGPASAAAVVRKALQVGAGSAAHLHDDSFAGSDVAGTALALARAVQVLDADDDADPVGLVVAGMAALDGLGGVVPALVAAELGWPVISFADTLEVRAESGQEQAHVVASRTTDDGEESLRADLPAVVSVTDTIATLRAPNFQTMLAARSAPIRELTAADLGLGAEEVGAAGARVRVASAQPRPPRPAPTVVTAGGAQSLVDFVIERNLLEVQA